MPTGVDTADELRRTRDRLVEAQRLARLGSWEWDIPGNEVTWSDELFRIYGLVPGEVQPSYEGFLERVHPDDRKSVDERNRRAFADHQPFEDIKRCTRPDGSEFLMRTKGEVITNEAGEPVRMLGVCEDVTAEKEAERALAELAAIVQSSDDAIVATTPEGVITSWNPGATSLYGYEATEAVGANMRMLVPADHVADEEETLARLMRGEIVEHYETVRRRKDGSLLDVSIGISPVRRADGSLLAISTIGRDVTERKRFEAQLTQLANNDPMTGLVNRRRFEEELRARVSNARRYGEGGAILLLDLDNFKYVNDGFGHSAGDAMLRSIASLLTYRLRDTDMLARLGGDEFAVLLPHADQKTAEAIAADLLAALRDHSVPIAGRPIRLTASIGIACFDAGTSGGEELLADADRAMYAAKDAGRDRAVAMDALEREGRLESRRDWEHRIREALERELFVLHAQPIVDLVTGDVSQYELLLRMKDGSDLIPPGAFLPVAERLGLVHAIDRWVAGQAVQLLSLRADLRLGVNLSALSIDDPHLIATIGAGISEHGVDPARLTFEITETAAIGSMDVARKLAASLHELGCGFALDDFGAGFSSFYYLKYLPAQFLKIDGDFVRSPRSRTDELVIEAIVSIAKGLGKRTVAEFVEDQATVDVLREVGVDYAQGFHLGRPAPVSELLARQAA